MENKPDNIKEARKLVKLYRSITVKQIRECMARLATHSMAYCAQELTGFSRTNECILCKRVFEQCHMCIYSETGRFGCCHGNNLKTYYAVYNADNPKELKLAFRKRADHIDELLTSIANRNKKDK